MMLEANQTLLFIGDSITDAGRGRPVGTSKSGLGGGYVGMVECILQATFPERRIRILNTGISGNRVIDLKDRWETDVLALKPDWLSVMIGINDVWRQFDSPLDPRQVLVDEFETTLDALVKRARPGLKGVVLMTPYYIETHAQDPMRRRMDAYGAVVKKLAKQHAAILVDTQAAFDAYLKHRPTQELCGDRVHPNGVGHMILARAFLKAAGLSG
jgi:lysophospholipase L1-like esterase